MEIRHTNKGNTVGKEQQGDTDETEEKGPQQIGKATAKVIDLAAEERKRKAALCEQYSHDADNWWPD